jgi:simple sugar transport system permease protein
MNSVLRRLLLGLAAPALALVFAVGVSALALRVSGHDPWHAYSAMLSYGKQSDSLVAIADLATAYFLAGLAVAVGFRMALFNIGVEGQYRLAALFAAAVGAKLNLPAVLLLPLVVLTAAGTGAAVAGIAGVLKTTRGVSEVISTIMLNFIALAVLNVLLSGALRTPVPGELERATGTLHIAARMPALDRPLRAIGLHVPAGSSVTGMLLVAAVLGVGVSLLLSRTRFGFALRATGLNPSAALASGVDAKAMVVRTMLLSGAIGGLAGLPFLLSAPPYRYSEAFVTDLGFTGIGIALLGRNRPGGIAVGAVVFAFLDRSSQILQIDNIPSEIAVIMQGLIVLSVVIAYEVVRRLGTRAAERSTARAVEQVLA